MAILESLLIALGTGIAKYLAKEVLPQDWQDQIAAELVSLGVRQLTARPEQDPVAAAIGGRVKTLYDRSSLAENDRNAVLIEVIRTLAGAQTDVEHLVARDLNPETLRHELLAARPDATTHFSADATALYEHMVWEACQGMTQVAGRLDGFATAQARAQLGRQTEMLVLLRDLAASLANWLDGPSERAARFERDVYRPALIRKLNKLEPFGIDEGDRYTDTLKLIDTFVEPDLLLAVWEEERGKAPAFGGDEPGRRAAGKQERRLPVFQALAGVQRLMVVAAAGAGKSTFLQWLAVCAAQGRFPEPLADWNRLVPFFIRLRDYQGQGFPQPEAFAEKITPMGAGETPDGWVREVLRRGDGLVLVDGVDEMRREEREGMLDALKELTELFPLSRFVVTSRPPAVDELAWPAWRAWLQEARFAESWLAEMLWPQIETFVGRWHDALCQVIADRDEKRQVAQNREAAVRLLQREAALRRLAATPLLCAMICALYQRQGDHIAPERLELYKSCVEMLLWERDRKHPRRKVPALADYHQFTKDQLLRLLSHLAYWMMDEGASAVSQERVVGQFSGYLPNLGLDAGLGDPAFEYFNERASMWDRPAAGLVEFRHRTFQEYLAAGWAMQQDKVGALAERAANTQWRETIVLAAGRGTPAQSWALLQAILARADDADEGDTWRYLLLLALDCLETCSELPEASQWQEVVARARAVFPPYSREEAEMVANGGSYAVDLLAYDPDYPEEIADYCIQALAAIGGDRALDALAAYANDERWRVQRAIGDAWSQFEAQRYANRVLAGCEALSLSALLCDLSRLRLLPNLTQLTLYLGGTAVSDLGPLAGLTQLTRLDLSGTAVDDLGPLAGLTQLTQLALWNTAVGDLGPLTGLTQLTQLKLGDPAVSDLGSLARLTQLTQLDLSGTAVDDLGPLVGLKHLRQFELRYTDVNNLEPLAGLGELTRLDLWGTEVSDLKWLAGLTQLTQLDLDLSVDRDLGGTAVGDLGPLAGLTQLARLNLGLNGTAMGDLGPLAGLTQLTQLDLDLGGTAVDDLAPLAGLTQLTQLDLDLSGTAVDDLAPLAGLTQLTQLSLMGTAVGDLGSLAGLTQLTQLDLRGTAVGDLGSLAGLTQLTQLDLRGTAVGDLRPLAGLTQLTQLDLSGTTVGDLVPLVGLPNLTALVIDEKRATEAVRVLGSGRQRGLAIYTNFVGGELYRYLPPAR
jgi:Leucine-rich repeat (LRR) protein